MRTFAFVVLTYGLWAGCKAEPLPQGDAAGFEAAFNQRDAAALGDVFAEDAVLLPPNAPAVTGRRAIEDGFEAGFESTSSEGALKMKLTYTETESTGDLGYKSGTYTMTDAEGAEIDRGHLLEVWKRGDDGWKIYRESYNSDRPPPATPLSEADVDDVQEEIEQAADALEDGDLVAWSEAFTEDAVLMPANSPLVRGRAAILDFGRSLAPMTEVSVDDFEIEGEGDMAVATSSVSVTSVVTGSEADSEETDAVNVVEEEGATPPTVQSTGKQLMVLRKQSEGVWLFSYLAYNSDLPSSEDDAE